MAFFPLQITTFRVGENCELYNYANIYMIIKATF